MFNIWVEHCLVGTFEGKRSVAHPFLDAVHSFPNGLHVLARDNKEFKICLH